MKQGALVNVQHFSVDDGPGIRTTVFFKGCNLRCLWCHNPESQKAAPDMLYYKEKCIGCRKCAAVCPLGAAAFEARCSRCDKCAGVCHAQAVQLVGRYATVDELLQELAEDMDIYMESGGGVTFSGGEPVLQNEFLLEVLQACKARGIHTAVETAGCWAWERMEALLPYIDLVYCDLKSLDERKHVYATGVSNTGIIENLRRLSRACSRLIVRIPVVAGFNEDELPQMASFIGALEPPPEVELLPYHSLCVAKYQALGRPFLAEAYRAPTPEQLKRYSALFEKGGENHEG